MARAKSRAPHPEILYAYEYHVAYERLLRHIYDGFHMLDPLLRRLPPIETEHHHRAIYTQTQPRLDSSPVETQSSAEVAQNGEPLELRGATHRFRATAHIDPQDVDIAAHTVFLYDLAQSYVESMKPVTEHHCREVAHAHGNEFQTGGEPLSWEHLLTMQERMPLSFDAQGRVSWPLLLLNGQAREDFDKLLEQGHATPEQKQRMEDIIESKRREHNARKRTRRLSRQSPG